MQPSRCSRSWMPPPPRLLRPRSRASAPPPPSRRRRKSGRLRLSRRSPPRRSSRTCRCCASPRPRLCWRVSSRTANPARSAVQWSTPLRRGLPRASSWLSVPTWTPPRSVKTRHTSRRVPTNWLRIGRPRHIRKPPRRLPPPAPSTRPWWLRASAMLSRLPPSCSRRRPASRRLSRA